MSACLSSRAASDHRSQQNGPVLLAWSGRCDGAWGSAQTGQVGHPSRWALLGHWPASGGVACPATHRASLLALAKVERGIALSLSQKKRETVSWEVTPECHQLCNTWTDFRRRCE